MYLGSTIPSSPSVYPYMGSYISILFYSILNIWGAHYHSRVVHFLWIYLLSEFQSPSSKIVVFGILVFLWIHFLPGFQSPVSKMFCLGFLSFITCLSTYWIGSVGGLSCGRIISYQVLIFLDKTSQFYWLTFSNLQQCLSYLQWLSTRNMWEPPNLHVRYVLKNVY